MLPARCSKRGPALKTTSTCVRTTREILNVCPNPCKSLLTDHTIEQIKTAKMYDKGGEEKVW